MADILQEAHAPENMRVAYRTLQQLYGEENIPLILGTEMHGGKTDMVRIEVGKDQMMLCLKENYHKVPDEYTDSAPFFVLGHEFGHIIAHPGKDAIYWIEGMRELPVEAYQKGRWLNCVSDILVNWTVITATGVLQETQKATIKKQMTNGWRAGQFVRRCNTNEGFNAHRELLKNKKVKDNRYQPQGGLPGQYDNASTADKYVPTAMTPFYQTHMGHGRGEQSYPPINYCVAEIFLRSHVADQVECGRVKAHCAKLSTGEGLLHIRYEPAVTPDTIALVHVSENRLEFVVKYALSINGLTQWRLHL